MSIVLGIFAEDVNSLLQWIVSGLYGGYVASNLLKWYWWRFNGHGYFWGMLAGLVPALIFPKMFPDTLAAVLLPGAVRAVAGRLPDRHVRHASRRTRRR